MLPSIQEIRAGNSILFLGSGFSAEATNSAGEQVKDVQSLLQYMLAKCGEKDIIGYDLDAAAEEYAATFGDEATVTLLYNNFDVKSVTRAQRVIVCQPWYRIYTSNYDNAVEQICGLTGKSYTTKETADPVERPIKNVTQLVHIYGNINRSSPHEFRNRFLLTERQRDNSPFRTSVWYRRFYDDILSADNVVFVGFSMNDLDIRRSLMVLPAGMSEKIHFVNIEDERRPIRRRLERFGQLHLLGTSGLAEHLKDEFAGGAERTRISLPAVMEELTFSPAPKAAVSSEDIRDLFVSGRLVLEKLSNSDVGDGVGSYTVSRANAHYVRVRQASGQKRPVLVHSDVGNGKTIFLDQVAYIYSTLGYRVFRVRREPENAGDIISFVQLFEGKMLLMFDDVMSFKSLVTSVLALGRSDLMVVASVRSVLLETSRASVEARMGNQSFVEVDLNIPSMDEIQKFARYIEENGLIGKFKNETGKDARYFIEKKCGGQLRDVVLSMFEAGVLHERVEEVLNALLGLNEASQKLLAFGALLTVAGFQDLSQLLIVTDLVDYNGDLIDLRETLSEKELTGLVRFDRAEIAFRSVALAEFALRKIWSVDFVLDTARLALFRIDQFYSDDDDFSRLSKNLLKFSHYGKLLRNPRDTQLVEKFYDDCRVLSVARRDPLFWVQRSICNMNAQRFDISEQFVATAYAKAKELPSFDTYQIDTHCAKLLLTRARDEGVSPAAQDELRAQNLLSGVIARRKDDLYHPLSIMRLYAEIVRERGDELDLEQRAVMRRAVDRARDSVNEFPDRMTGRFRGISALRAMLDEARTRL